MFMRCPKMNGKIGTPKKMNDPQDTNPALNELALLIGEWKMELSNASFLPHPSDTMTGNAAFEWAQGGAFLAMYMGKKPEGTPDATWLFQRDQSTANYLVFYYDARKVSRVYEMSFSDGTWKMWRNSPDFSQRFEGKVSEDGNTIAAHWEKSEDGANWEHDFDVTYTRVG